MDESANSRRQFYDYAERVRSDLSKCLDNPNLTSEERSEILQQEIEILNAVKEKDTEIRAHETETVKMVDKKDSEKRHFNWSLIGTASVFLIVGIGAALSALGGDFNLKLPKSSR